MTRRARLTEYLYAELDVAGDLVLTEVHPQRGEVHRIELDQKAWEALCLYMSRQGANDGD